ncbi:hypothetical protein C2G38_2102320 [Gigaspora rosea]|uniref:Uncharacterized protein n=1 Tax=Gigaspora rosea TaxID=44941 RepID=A0A397URP8_9GLOM|nr:hypothetical protein C2G38_2102320 [Gigaspora rosea]
MQHTILLDYFFVLSHVEYVSLLLKHFIYTLVHVGFKTFHTYILSYVKKHVPFCCIRLQFCS